MVKKTGKKHPFGRTDSLQGTSSMDMAKNGKKGRMVKIENHCNKKTRRGSPVDDRPYTDKIHHFVQKKKKM